MRTIREEERPTLLLMAAGAVAGAAAGLYLGRRYRTMDAFLEDVRDRFGALRDIWYEDDLIGSRRRARLNVDLVDEDEIEDDDVDEEFDELEEDEAEGEFEATSELYDEDEDEEELDEEDDEELEEDFEDELAAMARDKRRPLARIVFR